MPTFSTPPLLNSHASQATAVLVDYSAMVTLHTNTTAAASNINNPFLAIADSTKCLVSVPPGATFLDVYHVWRSGAALCTLTTRPKIRVFGEVPVYKGNDYMADPAKQLTSGYDVLANGYANWIPLPNRVSGSNNYVMDVGETTPVEAVIFPGGAASAGANGQSMSAPVGVIVKGVRRIIVTVDTPAAFSGTLGSSVLAGCFGYTLYS